MVLALAALPAQADVAPCYPAVTCNPAVSVNGGGTTTSGAASITITNMVPGTTVTVTWMANGQLQTATGTVKADGTTTIILPFLDPGNTVFTVTGFTTDANGKTVPVTRTGTVTSTALIALKFYVEAMKKLSVYRTWISGNSTAVVPSWVQTQKVSQMADCPPPFKYRIQKRKVQTIQRGSDEPTVRVSWSTLPKKYKTNKVSGVWAYQSVNLKKGTYRSVVNGKCGLLGGTTNTVTLKK
jgi:hypothetical protein